MSTASKLQKSKFENTKKQPEGKFYRDGAKYVCRSCKTNYFTKVEVEACFDKHSHQTPSVDSDKKKLA